MLRNIRLSVCRSAVYCGKMADWIQMPFGMVSGVGRRMGVLDGVVIVEGKGSFWGEFGASHGNQLGNCCVVVQKCVRDRAVVWGGEWVNPGIHVLDDVPHASRERVDLGSFAPNGSTVSMAYFVTEMHSTRA